MVGRVFCPAVDTYYNNDYDADDSYDWRKTELLLAYSVHFGDNNVKSAKILHTVVFVKLFVLEFVTLHNKKRKADRPP